MRHVQLIITTYNSLAQEIVHHDLWADEVDTNLRLATQSSRLYRNIPRVPTEHLRRSTRVYRDLKSMRKI